MHMDKTEEPEGESTIRYVGHVMLASLVIAVVSTLVLILKTQSIADELKEITKQVLQPGGFDRPEYPDGFQWPTEE